VPHFSRAFREKWDAQLLTPRSSINHTHDRANEFIGRVADVKPA